MVKGLGGLGSEFLSWSLGIAGLRLRMLKGVSFSVWGGFAWRRNG